MPERPTDDTIALVAFLRGGEWLSADEIMIGLEKLGFVRPSIQWVCGHLRAMCRESCPRFERRKMPWCGGYYEYRVTSWAEGGLTNAWCGFYGFRSGRTLSTPQPEGQSDA